MLSYCSRQREEGSKSYGLPPTSPPQIVFLSSVLIHGWFSVSRTVEVAKDKDGYLEGAGAKEAMIRTGRREEPAESFVDPSFLDCLSDK